ncbi:hypothetical protein WA026_019848 [Henosepilachna vigintioctopunctata]|uniref:Uncharacterized protein n=1 Tax=Henosepilachna vigintioctopunctata TaxID=420089 RepID=A0AAW1VIQ1_9CUCU
MINIEEEKKYTSAILDGVVHLFQTGVDIDKFMEQLCIKLGRKKQVLQAVKEPTRNTNKRQVNEHNYTIPKKNSEDEGNNNRTNA